MQTHIFDRNQLLKGDDLELIRRRLQFALGRFEGLLAAVDLRVSDENGPRGGIDKAVQLKASLKQGETLLVSDVDQNVLAAVTRAAERLGRSLARQVTRRRNRRLETESSSDK